MRSCLYCRSYNNSLYAVEFDHNAYKVSGLKDVGVSVVNALS
ncbi:hypothetical protein NLO413_0688 [Candidatus Neoehrlichia lotoris str. RAC413]|uniref:Uncharacterized protein n=1 Tax=Candidatus Neoehrlichia procyonis str. RAC413 TaxID=1359163 RepID=A0A0F3NNM4_9RICK|nr:hypothetical protein NLO413_0688 [Candidatus Neoehrlichia lotoris str. RAC413]